MKVLHALEKFLPISENWIYPQVMKVPGVEPAILCSSRANEELFPLQNTPHFPDPPPRGWPRLLDAAAFRAGHPHLMAGRQVARWQPDLIHAHFGIRGCDMLEMMRRVKVPLVTSFYGIDAWNHATDPAMATRLRELFTEGSLFFAEGPAMAARLETLGAPKEKLRVIRLGVDVAKIPFSERSFGSPLHVVMMARFVEKKGLVDGLEACAEAVRRGAELRVTIIGDGTDPAGIAIRSQLHEIAAAPVLKGRVAFPGFLKPTEAQLILQSAHIFLCPSKHAASGDAEGGSPLALTEAMASGLLCIGTRHCDLPELIRDGETGFVRDSGDVAGLADALCFVAENPAALPPLCRAGRNHVEAKFSIAQMVDNLRTAYDELLRVRS